MSQDSGNGGVGALGTRFARVMPGIQGRVRCYCWGQLAGRIMTHVLVLATLGEQVSFKLKYLLMKTFITFTRV